jgi:hypothetical protein
MLGKMLCVADSSDIPPQLIRAVLSPFLLNWCNNRFLSLLWQIFFILNRGIKYANPLLGSVVPVSDQRPEIFIFSSWQYQSQPHNN